MSDLISRQAAIDAVMDEVEPFAIVEPRTTRVIGTGVNNNDVVRVLEQLPSAQPERKKGHWLIDSDGYYPYCSECRTEPSSGHMTDFCPNCGADMREGNP